MSMTIGSNAGLYQLLNAMNRIESERAVTMARLSTGRRINRGSDDPAGLIALNSLRSELASVEAAINTGTRNQSFLNVADSTLMEVGELTAEIQELVVGAQGSTVTAEEKAAYQAQIDANIEAIDRLINSAEFNGQKIFNGENRVNATTDDADAIRDIKVYNRNPGVTGNVSLTVTVSAAAMCACSDSSSGYDLATALSDDAVIQVTGKLGTAVITLTSGSNSAAILAAINAEKEMTGVSAFAGSSGRLTYASTEKGSEAFVIVSVISGPQAMVDDGATTKVCGSDAAVKVNGQNALASGTEVHYNGNGLSLSFTLNDDTPDTHTVTVVGGGAVFNLGTDLNSRAALGLQGMNTYELGRADLGYLSSLKSGGTNSLTASGSQALAIAKEAAQQVAVMAGRVGGFNRYQVGSTVDALNVAKEELSDAVSQIGDTDYAVELAKLDRQNIIMQAAVSLLSMANTQASSVLSLLR
jgi:flagellin